MWSVFESVEVILGFVLGVVEIFQLFYLWKMSEDIDDIQDDIENGT